MTIDRNVTNAAENQYNRNTTMSSQPNVTVYAVNHVTQNGQQENECGSIIFHSVDFRIRKSTEYIFHRFVLRFENRPQSKQQTICDSFASNYDMNARKCKFSNYRLKL